MKKPKLIQKNGGYVCSNDEIVRWAETPEEAYAEYQRAYVEIGTMKMRIKQHCVAQIPLHKMSQADGAKIEWIDCNRVVQPQNSLYMPDFRSERAYPHYNIYENETGTIELLKTMVCVAVCSFIVYLLVF